MVNEPEFRSLLKIVAAVASVLDTIVTDLQRGDWVSERQGSTIDPVALQMMRDFLEGAKQHGYQ